MMAEEDRISYLPDEIIHHTLSFLDLKYAMQTSALSKKWKLVWTLLPQLNLDSNKFSNASHFNKFVNHALLHRNNLSEVSVLELRCRGAATQTQTTTTTNHNKTQYNISGVWETTVRNIVQYAGFHNVRRLTLIWSGTKHQQCPWFLFGCRALKDLTLAIEDRTPRCYTSESDWDYFPALEKLNLSNFELDVGKSKRIKLFSKCLNLKDLTLHGMNMNGLEELNLCVPQLSNLSVTFCELYPKVFNVVAPQLQNLTASVDFIDVLHCQEGFGSLDKVNLSWPESYYVSEKKTCLSQLLGVFQKLYTAKFLILDACIIKVLSSCMDQLLLAPCPFNNLKCLKMNTMFETRNGRRETTHEHVVVPVELKNYFLDKSPTATFITDYPQVERTSIVTEEDRISYLPDEIIHHILSFLDLKYAMQTSSLSKKWKLVWTLLPQLNLDSYEFPDMHSFNKFANHALLHRNHHREVSVLELRCRGVANQLTGRSIVNYACSHNVRRLTLVWSGTKHVEFPQFLFNCRSLVDLTLAVECYRNLSLARCNISESGWDFPSLEKLNLSNFDLDGGKNKQINLFSKCTNLKDLTLCRISMNGLEELNICAPQLSSLSVTFGYSYGHPKVLNVVAHELQYLTASVDSIVVLYCRDSLPKSTTRGFNSLKKVNLSWPQMNYLSEKKKCASKLLGVFQKLHTAKFLILDPYVIKALSSCVDQLLVEPCPFNNLKCLKMNTFLEIRYEDSPTRREHIVVPVQLKNYFIDKSPDATFIIDYPQNIHDDAMLEAETKVPNTISENRMLQTKIQTQDQVTAMQKEMFDAEIEIEIEMQDKVPHKRSSQQVHDDDDATAKKMAKLDLEKQQPAADTIIITQENEMLDANIQMQDQAITNQEAMFEVNLQIDEAIAKQKAMFESKIQIQDEVNTKQESNIKVLEQAITKQKAMFEARIQMLDQVIIKQNAKIQMQDEVITGRKALFEDERQMQDQVIKKHKEMFEAKIQMQDQVITKQKVMFEAKIEMLDQVSINQKAKIQLQDNVIAEQKAKIQMLEVANLDQEKLMSYVIKSKIAELKVQVESGNPDYELIRSIGPEIKSVMELIPESLRAVMDAQFSFEYGQLKSLFLTQIDASQWAKIETELGLINGL
ncbi:uncharacterized protein [Rutidosis leptorrhynchoides]|uniref:uncharacterized protein n=1 Tax=Rutidosis leptorrhynchoides TaxID=125765 RepID=UPI003A9A218E